MLVIKDKATINLIDCLKENNIRLSISTESSEGRYNESVCISIEPKEDTDGNEPPYIFFWLNRNEVKYLYKFLEAFLEEDENAPIA